MKKAIFLFLLQMLAFAAISQPGFSINAGLNLYCQNHVQDAVQESWDDYFKSVSSPNRVSSIEKVLFIPGFNAGVSVRFPLNKSIHFRTGLDFNMKGGKANGKYKSGNQEIPFSNKFTLAYIDLPLGFQYNVTDHFYLELGPELGYLVSVNEKEEENGSQTFESTDAADYNKLEFFVAGGGGYTFGESGFGVFARYIHGLSKVYTGEAFYSNVRNSTGQLGFFYRLSTKKK